MDFTLKWQSHRCATSVKTTLVQTIKIKVMGIKRMSLYYLNPTDSKDNSENYPII